MKHAKFTKYSKYMFVYGLQELLVKEVPEAVVLNPTPGIALDICNSWHL